MVGVGTVTDPGLDFSVRVIPRGCSRAPGAAFRAGIPLSGPAAPGCVAQLHLVIRVRIPIAASPRASNGEPERLAQSTHHRAVHAAASRDVGDPLAGFRDDISIQIQRNSLYLADCSHRAVRVRVNPLGGGVTGSRWRTIDRHRIVDQNPTLRGEGGSFYRIRRSHRDCRGRRRQTACPNLGLERGGIRTEHRECGNEQPANRVHSRCRPDP